MVLDDITKGTLGSVANYVYKDAALQSTSLASEMLKGAGKILNTGAFISTFSKPVLVNISSQGPQYLTPLQRWELQGGLWLKAIRIS